MTSIAEPTHNPTKGSDHWGSTVDAWFLDGYAPTKNPDLWKNSIYALMAATQFSEIHRRHIYRRKNGVRRAKQAWLCSQKVSGE